MFDGFGSGEIAILVGFHVFIVGMLALDLGVFHRQAHAVSLKEAALWSSVWVALAGLFAGAIWNYWDWWEPNEAAKGPEKALEFITGYLVEKSLSLDNLFVFLVIFRYFGVPAHLQHRVLIWGLLGALVFRAALIVLGAALLSVFHGLLYGFGAFLIYTAYRLFHAVEEKMDPGRNPVLRLARRFMRIVDNYDSSRFWVRRQGRWHATPLLLVLLVVETTDVVFALDSIPAIFGITQDTFIVYTSNIFAILGLRALYFLLAGFLGMFRHLNMGLALVLGFVGIKMILEPLTNPFLESCGIHKREQILISLGVVLVVLTGAVVASVLKTKKASKDSH
ncbi:MAG TPA: TerC family protein [Gemmataceae bacterium]|jgi:tellurite resistance protein TerC|nr:TerC family protein [Gemmataceae bacterium]